VLLDTQTIQVLNKDAIKF